MRNAFFLIGQIAVLTFIYQLSVFCVGILHLPVPASVFGMLLLLFLLSKKIVPIRFVEKGSLFLNKHLSFFFIPIAVGLITYKEMIQSSGIEFMAVIAGSSVLGLIITSGLSAYLSGKRRKSE